MNHHTIASIVTFLMMCSAPGFAQDSERAKSIYEAGMRAYQDGDFESAEKSFRESFRLEPQSMLLYNLSYAQSRLGKDREALESARAASFGGDLDANYRAKNDARIRALTLLINSELTSIAFKENPAPKEKPNVIITRAPVEKSASPIKTVGIAMTAVGVIGFVTATTINFVIDSDVRAFDDAKARNDFDEAERLEGELKTLVLIGRTALVSGAVLTVAGVVFWIVGGQSSDQISMTTNGLKWTF